jgi:exosortase/archaeosortase family protein
VEIIRNLFDKSLYFLSHFLRTTHGRTVICGLLIGLIYLVSWMKTLVVFIASSALFPFVTIAAAWLGLSRLWHYRQEISPLAASPLSRKLGHFAIWFGIALFPFCLGKLWSQALIWVFILIAIAFSSWGLTFFRRYWLPSLLLLFSAYPSLPLIPGWIWQFTMQPGILERFTAWSGSRLLALFGYSVTTDDIHIFLPTGGVSVYAGCTGFEMVITLFSISILVGIAFHMRWLSVVTLCFLGTILAFSLNLGRVALMTIATAEWGNQSFEFWHGFWGGQIFSGLLFTLYYYLVTWLLPKSPTQSHHSSSCSVKSPLIGDSSNRLV